MITQQRPTSPFLPRRGPASGAEMAAFARGRRWQDLIPLPTRLRRHRVTAATPGDYAVPMGDQPELRPFRILPGPKARSLSWQMPGGLPDQAGRPASTTLAAVRRDVRGVGAGIVRAGIDGVPGSGQRGGGTATQFSLPRRAQGRNRIFLTTSPKPASEALSRVSRVLSGSGPDADGGMVVRTAADEAGATSRGPDTASAWSWMSPGRRPGNKGPVLKRPQSRGPDLSGGSWSVGRTGPSDPLRIMSLSNDGTSAEIDLPQRGRGSWLPVADRGGVGGGVDEMRVLARNAVVPNVGIGARASGGWNEVAQGHGGRPGPNTSEQSVGGAASAGGGENTPVTLSGTIVIDGRQLGSIVGTGLAREAGQPSRGMIRFDPSSLLTFPNTRIPR